MPLPKIFITKAQGFTLIEVLIVVAIFTVIISLGLMMSFDAYRRQSLASRRDEAVSELIKARSLSMTNIDGVAHGARGVTFTQLSGTTTAQIIIISDGVKTKQIKINAEGGINW